MFVITGGGTGIGRSLAIALANKGHKVLIVGRRLQPLQEVATHSSFISSLSADVSTEGGQQNIMQHLHDIPKLTGLIHCAAVVSPIVPIRNLKRVDWDALLATNVSAPLFLTQALSEKLQSDGRVLFLSSKLNDPAKALCAYSLSKMALGMLKKFWQFEINEENKTSTSPSALLGTVMPGFVDTDIRRTVESSPHIDESLRTALLALRKQNLLLSPDTAALFLAWLLLEVEPGLYPAKDWDIYDTSHHAKWLRSPHTIPSLPDTAR